MSLMEKLQKFKKSDSGLFEAVNIVLALVMITIVGGIGIYIADTVQDTTGTPTQTNLSAMNTDLLSAGDTGSSFIVILVIAAIGGIAISYLFGMMGKRR